MVEHWDDLKILLQVYRSGSMTAAASHLGTSPATISRRMARLTEHLGFDALVRTPDGWKISDQITGLVEMVETFDHDFTEYLGKGRDEGPRRFTLNIGCPPMFSSIIFGRTVHRFLDANPGARVVFHDWVFQEGLGVNDFVITASRPNRGRVVFKHLCNTNFGLYALPDARSDLGWVGLSPKHDDWSPMQKALAFFGQPPSVRHDTTMSVFQTICQSGMPGLLPATLAAMEPRLQPIRGAEIIVSLEIFACYHETRRKDPIIQRCMSWITESIEETPVL